MLQNFKSIKKELADASEIAIFDNKKTLCLVRQRKC
jgi:hypothetical protein